MHLHEVIDTDKHYIIDKDSRLVSPLNDKKNKIVQFDHNSERFTFELPRYIEGHDMTNCNVVQVHYINKNVKTNDINKGIYEVTDIKVAPADEETVWFSWLLSGNATKYDGVLNFIIRFACTGDGVTVDYDWHTSIYSSIVVDKAIINTDYFSEQYIDILLKWKSDILSETGKVKSVNGVLPDEDGNVILATEDDALSMLSEMGIVDPVTDADGAILTDASGAILSL